MKITSDNHVHTSFSTDSQSEMEEMLLAAIGKGHSSICFTDHMDYNFPEEGAFVFDPQKYFECLNELEKKYPDIIIRKGIELGLKNDVIEKCNQLTNQFPFDFVIGSTHVVDNFDPYYPEYWKEKTEKEGIERYYLASLENAELGIDFDVFGHIDYIIRYTPTQQNLKKQGKCDEDYMTACLKENFEVIDMLLKKLLELGKGIELNTAGLKYGLGHPHPHETILKRYHELGGEIITVGSDGHMPEHFAYDFDLVPDILKECGFKYYTEFKNRKPVMIKLD